MLSIIKTAIITIIISFISGVLLDSYKNFAPRILCTMGKPVRLIMNDKKIWAFTLIMRNISNKTIHNLNLNIQGHYDNLKIDDAKITKGLKFDTSSENNSYNISIPFLSKNDELSVKIFVESHQGKIRKPIVTLRSPEDFKRVDSTGKNGYLATLAGIPKDISDSITKRKNNKVNNNIENSKEKSFFNYKKALITIVGIVLVIYAGILGNEYYDKVLGKSTSSNDKSNAQQTGASLEKSSIAPDTSSITGSTSSTADKNKSSNDVAASDTKTGTSSTKSAGDTSKDVSGKSASSGTSKNTKSSSESLSKDSSTASSEKESSEDSNKNAATDSTKASSTEASKTENSNSNSDNKQSDPKTSTNKTEEEEAPAEQGTKNKLASSSNTKSPQQSQSPDPSSSGASTN